MAETGLRVESNPNTAYEASDWRLGIVGIVFAGIIAFLTIATLVLLAAFPKASSDVSRALTVEAPQPRLQTDPTEDLVRFRADEEKRLNTYYWIDKKKGIVHIPIDQAMKEVVRKGIDGYPRGTP